VAYHFEWDESKAEANLEKHGVSFDEAATAFTDPFAIILADPDHSVEEERFLLIGFSNANGLLIISYTEKGSTIRLISARPTTKKEVILYGKNQN
jgi:uncharacterized protein